MRLQKVSKYTTRILILIWCLILNTQCKKLVEVDAPVTSITGKSVFASDQTAISAVTGLYATLSQTSYNSLSGLTNISKRTGLSGDELILWNNGSQVDKLYYSNSLASPIATITGTTAAGHEIWSFCFPLLFRCNQFIEELTQSDLLTPAIKKQLLGEAKFMRAFLYFYLVNLYGDLPLVLTSDFKVTRAAFRLPKDDVYTQIIKDLKESQSQLSENFLDSKLSAYNGPFERLRPTTWAANALLSRVYLYKGDYVNAESEATKVINNTLLFKLTSLDKAFIANNEEAIWQLQPVNKSGEKFWNTEEAKLFSMTSAPVGLNSTHCVYLRDDLINSFELTDLRRTIWVGVYSNGAITYNYPNKYKIGTPNSGVTEYLVVLRLAEQYLIRAEAKAHQEKLAEALTDLNVIRLRAGLSDTIVTNKSSFLQILQHERRIELFAEWGHRWLDLKRTGAVDSIMSKILPLKVSGATWRSFQQLYPLPNSDILANPNLLQNTGY